MRGDAVISDCGRYRYRLDRRWEDGDGAAALFVMLNPSTADAEQDDPTIRRCVGFAKRWGHNRLVVANLFAFRATKPAALLEVEDPVGPENDAHLSALASDADLVVAAWGAGPGRLYALRYFREKEALRAMRGAPTISSPLGRAIFCLGTTKEGHPRHPLYLPSTTGLRPFAPK